ncbi:hypothetical protein E4U54_005915 [Claviceps lovelessii]|nr:hypothetical protein E4U54_005915 [Claviceps lovelessii]
MGLDFWISGFLKPQARGWDFGMGLARRARSANLEGLRRESNCETCERLWATADSCGQLRTTTPMHSPAVLHGLDV